jgi:phosphoribosylformylglycinamidine cyclo-ligase
MQTGQVPKRACLFILEGTGDVSVWEGIARDAIAMNLDDLLCVGIYDNLLFSSTIDRNKQLIPGEILEAIINGSQRFFEELTNFGVGVKYLGGETADLGDVVRTITVNGTMTARWPKNKLVTNEKIRVGDVIVGLASYGRSSYESEYNSGIGSNGLTSARHDILEHSYALNFTESFDNSLDQGVVYIGPHRLLDEVTIPGHPSMDVGRLLLSPTRTYAPLMAALLQEFFEQIHGLVHCSGGGQTKCLKYLPGNFTIIKDNLFDPPPIFELIRESSGADTREMYQVFNMGHRLEVFTNRADADEIVALSKSLGIDAQVVGRVEEGDRKELLLQVGGESIRYV